MKPTDTHTRPVWRTVALLVAFALLVAVGVVTVLLPELEDDPDEDGANAETTESAENDTPPPEP